MDKDELERAARYARKAYWAFVGSGAGEFYPQRLADLEEFADLADNLYEEED